MDLISVKNSLNRVVKKQKTWHERTEAEINKMLEVITNALIELSIVPEEDDEAPTGVDPKLVMEVLQAGLQGMGAQGGVTQAPTREVNNAMTKCGKLMDKCFHRNLGTAYRNNVEFDSWLVNQLVASHFYQQGLFDVGDCFVAESQAPAVAVRAQFWEIHQIWAQIRARKLALALAWAHEHHVALQQRESPLEFQLQRLQFLQFLVEGNRASALEHARRSFSAFAREHMPDIQRLMGSLLWAGGRLPTSPYADMVVSSALEWDTVASDFLHECWALLGLSSHSPLFITLCAGSQALPTLMKVAAVMGERRRGSLQEWQGLGQVPVDLELGAGFQFHSVFVCPVSRDPCTRDNPAMLLPCGHVLCRLSLLKLAKALTRTFKCPYCPSEATLSLCLQLHF